MTNIKAIIKVLSDKKPRTSKEIWEEIINQNLLLNQNKKSFQVTISNEVRKHNRKIKRISKNPTKYIINVPRTLKNKEVNVELETKIPGNINNLNLFIEKCLIGNLIDGDWYSVSDIYYMLNDIINGLSLTRINDLLKISNIIEYKIDDNTLYKLKENYNIIEKDWYKTSIDKDWKSTYHLKDDDKYTNESIINSYLHDCIRNNEIVNINNIKEIFNIYDNNIYDILDFHRVKSIIKYFNDKYPNIFNDEDNRFSNLEKDVHHNLFLDNFILYNETISELSKSVLYKSLLKKCEDLQCIINRKIETVSLYDNEDFRNEKDSLIQYLSELLNNENFTNKLTNHIHNYSKINGKVSGKTASLLIEEIIRTEIMNSNSKFIKTDTVGNMGDLLYVYKKRKINIPLNIKINTTLQSSPNMVALKNAIDNVTDTGVYILIITRYDQELQKVSNILVEDYYDIFNYLVYNSGPGQTMLDVRIFNDYDNGCLVKEKSYKKISNFLNNVRSEQLINLIKSRIQDLPSNQHENFVLTVIDSLNETFIK